MSQEGGAAVDAEFAAGQEPELWDLEEDDAEEMADFEEAHALGGPPVEATVSRERKASCNGEYTDNTATEEDGAGWSPVLAGPKIVSTSYDEPQRYGTSGAVATWLRDHPSTGKFPRGASWCWFALARTRGDTGQLALTRRLGVRARDR